MSSNPIRLQYLLRRYLENKLNQDEMPEFWSLLSELSENDLVSEELHKLWDQQAAAVSMPADQVQSAYQQLQHKILEQKSVSTSGIKRMHRGWWYAAAAACLLLVWSVTWLTKPVSAPAATELLSETNDHPSMQTLPDGSIVSLNTGSIIDSIVFTETKREVYLRGEGFFNVQHNAGKPFLVHANGIITRVLGTSFNVKSLPGENRVAVTVTKGRVQVEKAGQAAPLAILTPGEQLVVEENNEKASVEQANIEEVIEWKNSALLFDNQSLPEATELLSRQFLMEIRLSDTVLQNQRFTADFSGKKLPEILDIISVLTGTSWRKQGEIVLIEETKKLP